MTYPEIRFPLKCFEDYAPQWNYTRSAKGEPRTHGVIADADDIHVGTARDFATAQQIVDLCNAAELIADNAHQLSPRNRCTVCGERWPCGPGAAYEALARVNA